MKSADRSILAAAASLILGAAHCQADPVAHWTFDANGLDSSGNSRDTTLHGDATIAAGGRIGAALRVDGSGDFASTHNGSSSNYDGITGSNARSISLWIKAEGGASNAAVNDAFIGWGGTNATARNRFDLGLGNSNDSQLRVELNAGFAQSTANTVNFRDGNWHHVTLSYSAGGTSVSLYANGKLYQTIAYSSSPVNTTDVNLGVYIGCGVREGSGTSGLKLQTAYIGNPTRFWQGLIDDTGIWDSAVTATDAALLNGLGRIGNNDLSTLAPAAALWNGALNGTAVINGITWQKVTGLSGSPGDWSQVGGNNGVGSFIVLDGSGGGIQIAAGPDSLTWVGTTGGGTWDQGTTAHWKDASNNPTAFQDFDAVKFDDNAATGSVTLAGGDLVPESLAFSNDTLAYTLGGGSWSGTGTFSKSGSAEVTLAADSNYSGTATITSGSLRIGNGGTSGSLGYATIVNNGALVIQRDGTLALQADITGAGTLDILGPGTVILSGINTHTGTTTVSGGTLRSSGSLVSPVTVKSGATLTPGPPNRTGTLRLASLSLDTGSRSGFRVGFTNSDSITMTTAGGLAINGSHSLDLIPTEQWLAGDEFTLFTYDTTFTGNLAALQVGSAPHGNYTILDDTLASEIVLRVDSLDTLVWKGTTDSNWNLNQTSNWQLLSNSSPAEYFAYDEAHFDGTAANTTVNLADSIPVGKLVFNFSSPTHYLLTGPGSLNGFGSLEKSGTGTLTIATANTYTGSTTVTAGTLAVTGSLGATTVNVASGATLGGNGNIGGPVTIQAGGIHTLEIAAEPGLQITRAISGPLVLEPDTILTLTAATPPAAGTYILATASGGITGTPGTINLPPGVSGNVTTNSNNIELTVLPSGDYITWAGSFPGLTDTAPDSDPDNDGLTNFEEYAFGIDPTSGSGVSPVSPLDKTTGSFTYTRRKQSLSSLDYSYKSSTTLGSWAAFTPASVLSDNGNPVETITVTLPANLLAEDRLFLRVESSEP